MGSHHPFGHLRHKLWPKERSRVKLTIWFLTIKSWESPWFPCVQVACDILLESSRQGLQVDLDLISIEGLHTKLWTVKVTEVTILRISGLPFRNLGTKCHLDASLVAKHRVYYKGEGGGFPKSGPWWVLWVRVCPWLIRAPKVL
jgi:hypothetical protein